MMIEAKSFHPMRDHMQDQATILFSDGSRLTLHQAMAGWELLNRLGDRVFGPCREAYGVTTFIVAEEIKCESYPAAEETERNRP